MGKSCIFPHKDYNTPVARETYLGAKKNPQGEKKCFFVRSSSLLNLAFQLKK
jgi:hypothetical protein